MKKTILLGFALLVTGFIQAQETPVKKTKVKTEVQKTEDGTKVKTKVEAQKGTVVKTKTTTNTDKVTGTYNGKTVYTNTKGKYYINSNGNKTYIDK